MKEKGQERNIERWKTLHLTKTFAKGKCHRHKHTETQVGRLHLAHSVIGAQAQKLTLRLAPCSPPKRYREPWYKLVVTEETKFSREVIGCYSCEKHLRLSQVRQLSLLRKPCFSGLPTAALRPHPVPSISAPAATARLKRTDRMPALPYSPKRCNSAKRGRSRLPQGSYPKPDIRLPYRFVPRSAAVRATAPLSLDHTSSRLLLHLTYF